MMMCNETEHPDNRRRRREVANELDKQGREKNIEVAVFKSENW